MIRSIALLLFLASVVPFAQADEIVLLPGDIVLDGPKSSQRVIVEARDGDRLIADRSAEASLRIEDEKVAEIAPEGTVRPKSNGRTHLLASVGNLHAKISIEVKNFDSTPLSSFRNDVLPVLTRTGCNSGACHGAAAGKNGLRLTLRGYGPEVDFDVLTRQALGRRVDRSSPEKSLLLLKPTGTIEHGGGIRFTPESPEYRILADWIADGTPRPRDDEPSVVKVTCLPRAVKLQPGVKQRVIVQALYSNGQTRDVTRWAKFASADESVAKVDEFGLVTVEGRGEAAVTVSFSGLVDRSTVSVPSNRSIDPAIFTGVPRRNAIDVHNLKKLESLGIPPSPEASDATYLRRVYLDLTGTLPPVQDVREFLSDKSPTKRATLVERLLKSDEYIDYWAYKWSDLFLVSSKNLPPPAMWAFSRSIRRAVSENLPWDAFARRILTAKGSTLTNGSANFFVLHRDPIELTDSVSVAFLGMSLTCARCHNHPMEKWTQDQYYGLANMFSRVNLKDGQSTGEVIVSAASDGDLVHPRKGVVMPPQPLDGKALAINDRTDRREAFVDWLASPENPYFDRAIVNRVWRNFFGRGLIDPEDDLRASNPASDEELLGWLVEDFRANKRDIKHLIRTIMASSAYQRSSESIPGNESDLKFLSHYTAKRLSAEVLLDAIGKVTEVPTAFAGYPAGWRTLQLPDAQIANGFLTSFGRPERLTTCSCERSSEPSVSQALHLANGDTINPKLRDDKGAVARASANPNDAKIVEDLYLAAFSRFPSAVERDRLVKVIADSVAGLKDAKEAATARRQAIEDIYWAVLTGKEFLFNH